MPISSVVGIFGPFVDSWQWLKAQNPGLLFKKRRLNFITIHYLYILFLSLLGSLLIFAGGNIDYIDALFFASGCATQSGLNTVDINKLNTYQQVVFFFLTMIATPIFIHTSVVFVRLYWFERRFQHIVREARNLRRTRTRSRTKTEAMDNKDAEEQAQGVRGRSIVVLHKTEGDTGTEDVASVPLPKDLDNSEPASTSSSSQDESSKSDMTEEEDHLDKPPTLHREVTFADEVDEAGEFTSSSMKVPRRLSPEEHIAFLEKQRNNDKRTLRIPGPRDFDRGDVPETVIEDDDRGALGSLKTVSAVDSTKNVSSEPIKRNITIDKPPRQIQQRVGSGLSKISVPPQRSNHLAHEKTTSPDADEEGKPPNPAPLRARTGTFSSIRHWGSREPEPAMPYLSWQPTIGRNSAFVDLTEEQREELGGIEYRSLKTLAIVLVLYYVVYHVLAPTVLMPWIVETDSFGSIVESDGINRVWWGIFTPASLFNDLGYTLTPNSMISFQRAVLPLFLGTFLIIIGNTGFPCMLRLVLWLLSKFVPRESGVWEELKFLLDHPRRCFTLLFPTDATAWLFWILVFLNGLDVILFMVLDLHDPVVTEIGGVGYRILNGLFQASSTRTAGFAIVNLAELHPGIQVSYMIMMYISVFPIAISIRRTNVYEEKSLGIYSSGNDETEDASEPSYIGAHLRRQLSFDLWFIFLGLFIIGIAESAHLRNTNEYAFTMFSCLFEIVSAYGTVGLSLGYPDTNTSFCAQFSVLSKLVLIAMEIRGRHRGLPYELDRAILLPSELLHETEDADAARRVQRRNSSLSNIAPVGSALGKQPAMPRTATQGTATGRESKEHSMREYVLGEHGHSGKAGSVLGKLMADSAIGPRLERREKYTRDAEDGHVQ
ncbi:MAG: hypothetical protein Q9177_000347 [Variospora cf. flavescens]